ncbi:MAG: hypothetical protein ACI81L_000701 [Verrucomicrobiales bacterium]|jgi:uncharacterized protein YndB with AHSA1/START domain
MRSIRASAIIDAPKSAVWALLADFSNVADWNSGVIKSHLTSEANSGVGAQRHCDVAPGGEVEETIRKWEPETTLVISIDSTKEMPFDSALETFTLEDNGGSTSLTMDFEYTPIDESMGAQLDEGLTMGFNGVLAEFAATVEARALSS